MLCAYFVLITLQMPLFVVVSPILSVPLYQRTSNFILHSIYYFPRSVCPFHLSRYIKMDIFPRLNLLPLPFSPSIPSAIKYLLIFDTSQQ